MAQFNLPAKAYMQNPQKIKITENSVQATLVFPVWGRASCATNYPQLCHDQTAIELLDKIDYDFTGPQFKKHIGIIYGIRQRVLIHGIKKYIENHPEATIINLGCGLDTSFNLVDNGKITWINLDLPEVINFRNQLLPASQRETNLAHDALDLQWLGRVDFDKAKGIYIIAGGVIYYFMENDVKTLFCAMAQTFAGGAIYFDCENQLGVDLSNKTIVKSGNSGSKIQFAVNNASEKFAPWSNQFKRITEEKSLPANVVRDIPWKYKLMALSPKIGTMKFVEIEFAKQAEK